MFATTVAPLRNASSWHGRFHAESCPAGCHRQQTESNQIRAVGEERRHLEDLGGDHSCDFSPSWFLFREQT